MAKIQFEMGNQGTYEQVSLEIEVGDPYTVCFALQDHPRVRRIYLMDDDGKLLSAWREDRKAKEISHLTTPKQEWVERVARG